MTSACWLSYRAGERPEDKWDSTFVKRMIGVMPATHEVCDDTAVVVVPGGVHEAPPHLKRLRDDLRRLDRVVLVVTADEQNLFPVHEVQHDGVIVWRQTPRTPRDGHRFIGFGVPPDTRTWPVQRSISVYLSGQVTHDRRVQCFNAAKRLTQRGNMIVGTHGFMEGFRREDYLRYMSMARVALCPAGAATPDTFRVYEAITCGAVPIVDALRTDSRGDGYWDLVYGDNPLVKIHSWEDELEDAVRDVLDDWEARAAEVQQWFSEWSTRMCRQFEEDVQWTTE